jgi:hypothetical protein
MAPAAAAAAAAAAVVALVLGCSSRSRAYRTLWVVLAG